MKTYCEDEFVAVVFALREVSGLEEPLNEIELLFKTAVFYCNNLGAIKVVENESSSGRTKHVAIRLELIKNKS